MTSRRLEINLSHMVFTVTLSILIIFELLVLSVLASVYYRRQFLNQRKITTKVRKELDELEEKFDHNILSVENISKQFSSLMCQYLDIQLYNRSESESLLVKRCSFIEAEIKSLIEKEEGEVYWDNLCNRLADLLPTHLLPTDGIVAADDDPDITPPVPIEDQDNEDIDIPILESEVSINPAIRTMVYVTLNPLQSEIKRLKRIIGRHFGLIGDLKDALTNRTNNSEINLPKLVKELQITHVQFSRSLKSLTKENSRLTKLLSTNGSVTGNSSSVLEINKQRAIKPLKEPAKPKKRHRSQSRP